MDYQNMSDEALYWILRSRVPGIDIREVDDSNRNTVVAILQIMVTNEDRSDVNG